jgi:hypothetical protein
MAWMLLLGSYRKDGNRAMNRYIIALIALMSSTWAQAEGSKIRVLVTCTDSSVSGKTGHPPISLQSFIKDLEDNLLKEPIERLANVRLPVSITLSGTATSTQRLAVIKVSEEALYGFLDRFNGMLEDAHHPPFPKSLASALEALQRETSGICDFVIPTGFQKIVH